MFKQQQLSEITVEVHPLVSRDYAFVRKAASLDETETIALTSGILNEEGIRRWRSNLEKMASDDVFFGHVNQVMVVGCKP